MRLPFQRDRQTPARGALAGEGSDDALAAARVSARRRLIGAAILLAIGVAGFPLLFETQPRPLPSNLPIVTAQNEVPRSSAAVRPSPRGEADGQTAAAPPPRGGDAETAPATKPMAAAEPASAPTSSEPVPAPVPAPAPGSAAAPASAAGASPAARTAAAAPAASGPTSARATAAATPASSAPPARATTPTSAPPATTTATSRADPRPSPPPKPPPDAAAAEGRFVVQVGAYSDAGTLRDTRQKVEKLGLKTYTQVIEGDAGRRTRVRVGPFATRTEAQAAAAKLKAAGLPANLLTL
ncbi:MAG: SPOR domain-containing protein [Burkholderiaceae bacterium]|nr:SPOR domain-containing protein [Burkholderiaceae bacterium]